jgi:tetratricopeptide (TPR) repeat protein
VVEDPIASNLEVENQRNLRRLVLSIRSSLGRLNLLIAICDNPRYRDELIQTYEAELREQGITCERIRLDRKTPSLKDSLLELPTEAESGPQVVTVLGADELLGIRLSEAKSAQEKFFFSVQWTREGLRAFPYPIVLWVTEEVAVGLGQEAPDFWSWRGGLFEFVRPRVYEVVRGDGVIEVQSTQTAESSQTQTDPAELAQQIQSLLASDPDSPLLASLYFSLGNAYRVRLNQGRATYYLQEMNLAVEAFQQAIKRQEHSATVDLAGSLNNLAGLYRLMGRYEAALPLYEQALEIRKAELGERHPSTATGLNNLAELYRAMGRYAAAEPLYVESLEISKAELGDRHPDTATSLNNLALLYYAMGRYAAAEPLYVESLEISKAEQGERHPDTATSLNNLATLYYSTDRLPEAAAMMSDALIIFEEKLGLDHPNTVRSRKSLENIQQAIQNGQP